VSVKVRGGRAKGVKRFVAALDGGSAGATCAATLPDCGPVTSAITLGNGTVAARRGDWC
jgi:hypothetical protein